jgi:gliding motility-associated-like protein
MVVDTILVKILPVAAAPIKADILVPQAWSPNGDGHNDLLYPFTINIRELKYFRIYNRWGELVFETKDIGRGWDGIYKGKPQVMDAYVWMAEGISLDGSTIKRSGKSALLR